MLKIAFLVVGVALTPQIAAAEETSTLSELSTAKTLPGCKREPGSTEFQQGLCFGQVLELYLLASTEGLSNETNFCPPDKTSILDASQIIIEYVERVRRYSLPFFINARAALREKWPCAKQ